MKGRAARSTGAPPLWIWPLAVTLVFAIFFITLDPFLDEAATEREVDQSAQRTRIAEFARRRDERPDALAVIALGDSSLRNATFFDEQMERYARKHHGPDLLFLRIVVPGGTLHDFLGLLREILASEPDLLLVQSWLVPDRSDEKQRAWHRAYRAGGTPDYSVPRERHREQLLAGRATIQHQTWILDRVVGRLAGWLRIEAGLGRRFEAQRRQMFCNPSQRNRVLKLRNKQYPPGGDYNVDPAAATTIDLLVEQVAAVGAELVFFDVPVASPASQIPGIQRKLALQRAYFALHAGNPAFDHWRLEQTIPDEQFCDWLHLTPRGRRNYARWFVLQLAQAAEEREAP